MGGRKLAAMGLAGLLGLGAAGAHEGPASLAPGGDAGPVRNRLLADGGVWTVAAGGAKSTGRVAGPRHDLRTDFCQIVSLSTPLTRIFIPVVLANGVVLQRGERIQGVSPARMVQAPAHGTMTAKQDANGPYYEFISAADYIGPDRASFLVEVNGKRVLVRYTISIIVGGPENMDCPVPPYIYKEEREWLQKQRSEFTGGDVLAFATTDIEAWLRSAAIDAHGGKA